MVDVFNEDDEVQYVVVNGRTVCVAEDETAYIRKERLKKRRERDVYGKVSGERTDRG